MTPDQIPGIIGFAIVLYYGASMVLRREDAPHASVEPTPEEIRHEPDEALERVRRVVTVSTSPLPEESKGAGDSKEKVAAPTWWARYCEKNKKLRETIEGKRAAVSFVVLAIALIAAFVFAPSQLNWEDAWLARLVAMLVVGFVWFVVNNLFRKAGDEIPLEDLSPEEAALEFQRLDTLRKLKKVRKELNLDGTPDSEDEKKKKDLLKKRLERDLARVDLDLERLRAKKYPPPDGTRPKPKDEEAYEEE